MNPKRLRVGDRDVREHGLDRSTHPCSRYLVVYGEQPREGVRLVVARHDPEHLA